MSRTDGQRLIVLDALRKDVSTKDLEHQQSELFADLLIDFYALKLECDLDQPSNEFRKMSDEENER